MADEVYLDLGCGSQKKAENYIGIDKTRYEGVNICQDLRFSRLPFENNSVDGVFCSHFVEHLTFEENVWLFNEVYRILKPDHLFEVIVPHGLSYASICDISHKTHWTEDTFGYFTRNNTAHYEWDIEHNGETIHLINRWEVLKNDTTHPYKYTVEGWVEVKMREIHAILKKGL